ncbi:MAG: hypothetical protein LBI91_00230, partial [Spirochaetaceae bacterium]|nr:hypothetical protein [Spirochaetaceae bacterium]
PADVPPGGPQPALWRPFLDGGDGPASGCREAALPAESAAPFLIPVLPFPWAGAPRVLAFGAADAAVAASAGETLSPVTLAAAARAVYNLIAALGQGRPPFQKISRALSQNSPWKRRGAYLSLSVIPDGEGYTALFRRFLDAGYLLPPRPGEPAILPGILSPGEEAGLAALLNS